MVSAWASENQLSLGQVVVDEKSNEITAIPELLRLLDVSGALVTIDAMGCQKEIAELIRRGEGDYVLAVKQNQPTLYERVEAAIGAGLEQDASDLDEHQTVEVGHGRREARTYVVFPAPETVDPEGEWRDLGAVGMAITESTDSQGRSRLEARYYILSSLVSAKRFSEAVRGHWGIENNLHWQLDVGAHLVVVELDTETGAVEIVRTVTCDDCGTILNPNLVEGQRHGGIAQGLAQALLEEVRYDDDGNPVTGNFADYAIVSAAELPSYELIALETPTPNNPLGAKGIGESGAIGSTPALQSAVCDALAPFGVRHIDIPVTAEKVWAAISRGGAAGERRRHPSGPDARRRSGLLRVAGADLPRPGGWA
jgi:CO/xanthine dehydrogenase Mo-binding subunit